MINNIQTIITLIFALFISLGQQGNRVIIKYDNSEYIKEIFDVLSNSSVKHGEYYLFYPNEFNMEDYELNKDNLSDEFHGLREYGKFDKGAKKGVWQEFIEDGKLIKQFDYDNNLELEPKIRVHLKYPPAAVKNQIQGTVKIKVNYYDCLPSEYTIIEDIGYGCANSAIQMLEEKKRLSVKYNINQANCIEADTLKFTFRLD